MDYSIKVSESTHVEVIIRNTKYLRLSKHSWYYYEDSSWIYLNYLDSEDMEDTYQAYKAANG